MKLFLIFLSSLLATLTAKAETSPFKKHMDPYGHLIDYSPTADAVARLLIGGYQTNCSGSLIAPNIVLSNRHCIEGNTGEIYAVMGQNPIKGEAAFVTRVVTTDMPRQIYNMTTASGAYSDLFLRNPFQAMANDLVLLILDHNITHVKPIQLLPAKFLEADPTQWQLRVIGYPGDYAQYDEQGLTMPLSNLRTCNLVGSSEFKRVLQTNCYAFPGNSGGPVITNIDGVDYILGSASTMLKGQKISFFTSVTVPEVAAWIQSVIEIEKEDSPLELSSSLSLTKGPSK